MAKIKQILSGNRAKIVVNLDEIFGVDVPNDSRFRQAVGQAIIDKIRERTLDGIDRNGKQFKNYSNEYADTVEFKAYGKSKNQPNLKQTGEMLGFLDVIEEDTSTITIGWNDDLDAAKAHGHITGNIGVKRDFLGLPDNELNSIASELSDLIVARNETPSANSEVAMSSVGRLSQFITGERTVTSTTTLGNLVQSLFDDGEG